MAGPLKAGKPATYDDANLLLRLYELRRDERLRQAREWFFKNFHVRNLEEFSKLCPLGSQENAYFRMVSSYWEMAASLVTSGVLQRELFMQNSRELLFVWIRMSEVVPLMREAHKNPDNARNTESVADAMIELEKERGSYETFRNMVLGGRP